LRSAQSANATRWHNNYTLLFASEGARVAVTDSDESGAVSVAKEIEAAGGIARAWTLDVVDSNAIISVTRQFALTFGGIDYLINNAGVSGRLPVDGGLTARNA
jgi:3-oxoacyl-[acyl-carrier protein] reductase